MKKNLVLIWFLFSTALFVPMMGHALTFTEDFSGDLSNWTAGPSHLDSYGITGGELFLDGYGHLTGPGGWGVLQFNEALGSTFTATWDAKITSYDYSNFVLSTDWGFNSSLGYTDNGYVAWLDIDDPVNPLFDVVKRSSSTGDVWLPGAQNVSVIPDIANNQWFNWKIEKTPSFLKVYIDDNLVLNTFDAEFANANYKLGLSFGEDSEGYIDNLVITTAAPVPEPSTMLLLGTGLVGLIGYNYYRSRKQEI